MALFPTLLVSGYVTGYCVTLVFCNEVTTPEVVTSEFVSDTAGTNESASDQALRSESVTDKAQSKDVLKNYSLMIGVFVGGMLVMAVFFGFFSFRKRLKSCCCQTSCTSHRCSGTSYSTNASRNYEDLIIPTPINARRSNVSPEGYEEINPLFGQVMSDATTGTSTCRYDYVRGRRVNIDGAPQFSWRPGTRLSPQNGNVENLPAFHYSYAQSVDAIHTTVTYHNCDGCFTTKPNGCEKVLRSHTYVNSPILPVSSQYLTVLESRDPTKEESKARKPQAGGNSVSADDLNKRVKDNQDVPYAILRGKELSFRNNLSIVNV